MMKFKNTKQWIAVSALGAMSVGGLLATSTPASADSKTWKKAAIAAGVVTGYGAVKGKKKTTIVGGAATVGSYYMYKKSKKKENNKEAQRRAWYQNRYGKNWRNHYRPA